MSDFFKVFLREDPRKLGAGADGALFLGAFGKHPGWNDHIEEDERARDLGLRTESLVRTKVLLYVQGIGRNLDTGAWEKLEPAQRLGSFNHLFLWRANDQFILGRMWSSSDGKGRTRYPMVLAAHAVGIGHGWVLNTLTPRLERLREQCASTPSATDVAALVNKARDELRAELSAKVDSPPPLALLSKFVQHPDFGPGREGLLRVLYQMQQQCAPFARGRFNTRMDPAKVRAQDLRVPAAGRDATEIFTGWTRLLEMQMDAAAPVLLLWPIGEAWLDILLGEPTPDQFFCLGATTAKLPCASEIPFNLDASFSSPGPVAARRFSPGQIPQIRRFIDHPPFQFAVQTAVGARRLRRAIEVTIRFVWWAKGSSSLQEDR